MLPPTSVRVTGRAQLTLGPLYVRPPPPRIRGLVGAPRLFSLKTLRNPVAPLTPLDCSTIGPVMAWARVPRNREFPLGALARVRPPVVLRKLSIVRVPPEKMASRAANSSTA